MEKLAKKFGGAGGPMGGGFPGFPGRFSFSSISYNFFLSLQVEWMMKRVEPVEQIPTISIDLLSSPTLYEDHISFYFFHFVRSTIIKNSLALVIVTSLPFPFFFLI